MSNTTPFPDLLHAVRDRRGLALFLGALGLEPAEDVVPPETWAAYGLRDTPVTAVVVAGRSGPLEALLLEIGAGCVDRAGWLARRVRARNPARLHLFVVAEPGYGRLVLGTFGLDGAFRRITLERGRLRASDLDALEEMTPQNGERGLELALRFARALDRSRVTRAFFRDFRGRREAVAEAWTGAPGEMERERAQLALLFLSRLTFLYFLQRRGVLAGDDRYLVRLFGRWAGEAGGPPSSFYRARLQPLFFGALNRRPGDRDAGARALGELPYLNGGLFERHALERRFPDLDLPDAEVRACLDDLLERYRFTAREDDGADHAVDPEILGRVFEGLMAPGERGDTGSFYTPAPVVNRVVREAVTAYVAGSAAPAEVRAVVEGRGAAVPAPVRHRVRRRLERVRVLDPACGSGAFLLGALQRLTTAVTGLSHRPPGAVRREVVRRSLHGVDLLDDAALLCALRLWLALSSDGDEVRPLPNLDRRIRQGDALVDPLDLEHMDRGPGWQPLRDPGLRRALRVLPAAARDYVDSGPGRREAARARVRNAEMRVARAWVRGLLAAQRQRIR
ncbi:MAG: DNA methyltransferase, partial [Gemmatimonadota bacterium]